MSELFSSKKSVGTLLMLTLLFVFPGTNAASNPSIVFADQIIGEISALKTRTLF